ncbi:F-box-like/WD repeat-containing protein TBL1Y [Hypsizygus marmoreus]|uniref:F-box-like/WD repeat-containing protein TBL1Y n=1 Tax=Hypsizygus marmoreus TaxID=39966 RepID=A0A369K4H4_HYPMA|nr:F-box-like/WD repeat-containing protein TBL1Y [Hypsizygus marmoreus]
MAHALRINADEINCLIYAYLQDSGFVHSAFAIRMEGQLDRSPHSSKHIPRGELIDLLSKALLYLEVEYHWKGDKMTNTCKAGFSLLEPHACSLEPPSQAVLQYGNIPPAIHDISMVTAPANGLVLDSVAKRKTSPTTAPNEGPAEKRTKRDSEDMDLDSSSESSKMKAGPAEADNSMNGVLEPIPKKPSKSKPRLQGPADDVTNPEAILLLPGHRTEVFVCAFNPVKPEQLATGSKDAVVILWSLPKNPPGPDNFSIELARPHVLDYFAKPEAGDLTALHWNSEGTLVAIGSYDSVLRVCTSDGKMYLSHPQHQGPIFATRFSKSGKWLLTASLDGTACLWDVKEKRVHRQYRCHTDCCLDVDWLDENTFVTCGADQLIHIMRVDTPNPLKTLTGHMNEINQIKCNPAGTRLASCSDDMTARVWNVQGIVNPTDDIPGLVASDAVIVLEGHKHSVSTIAWCPDRNLGPHPLIATSSFDGTARLWDSVTGECLKTFADHKRPVYALAFSPDGSWLATGSGDGWLHIYDVLAQEKRWSWFAGAEKPGVFEIDWQVHEGINRIALALECRLVAVIDVTKIAVLNGGAPRRSGTKPMHVS